MNRSVQLVGIDVRVVLPEHSNLPKVNLPLAPGPILPKFNFFALTNYGDGYTEVLLRLNEIGISIGQGWSQYDTLAITSTLALQKGETIDTLLWSGSIYGGYWTQFTGILLEEDLVLS